MNKGIHTSKCTEWCIRFVKRQLFCLSCYLITLCKEILCKCFKLDSKSCIIVSSRFVVMPRKLVWCIQHDYSRKRTKQVTFLHTIWLLQKCTGNVSFIVICFPLACLFVLEKSRGRNWMCCQPGGPRSRICKLKQSYTTCIYTVLRGRDEFAALLAWRPTANLAAHVSLAANQAAHVSLAVRSCTTAWLSLASNLSDVLVACHSLDRNHE